MVENGVQTSYTINEKPIAYKNVIAKYSMPFEFLVALLQISQNPEWVAAVADLAMKNSKIDLVIQDCLTTITEEYTSDYTYKEIDTTNNSIIKEGTDRSKTTIVTKLSKVVVYVAEVDTWMVNMEQEYDRKTPDDTENSWETEEDGAETEGTVRTEWTKTNWNKQTQSIITYEKEVEVAASMGNEDKFLGLWKNGTGEYIPYYNIDGTVNDAALFDRNGKEVRYAIPGNDIKEAPVSNILSGRDMLFDLLAEGERTQAHEEIMRHLIKIYTDENYDRTLFDFSRFNDNEFTSVGRIRGGSIQEKVWFALKGLGYSEFAIAGAMGNIDYESGGFNSSAIEGGSGEGIGLCQWSFGRKTELKDFAASEGKEWTDEEIQIRFLMAELTPGGGANGYARYQLMSYRGYTPSDWINATTVEAATEAFCHTFERPNVSDANSSMAGRTNAAKNYYDEFQGKEKPTGGDIAVVALDCHDQLRTAGYVYAQAGISIPIDIGSGRKTVDCSSYVSWVCYEYGFTNEFAGYQKTSWDFEANPWGWEEISVADMQEGDILVYNGHVEMYAGSMDGDRPVVYNCGGNSSISNQAPSRGGHGLSSITKILRVP